MINIFREVAKSEDFLSLSSEDVVKIISCNDLAVPYEEKVSQTTISTYRIIVRKINLIKRPNIYIIYCY